MNMACSQCLGPMLAATCGWRRGSFMVLRIHWCGLDLGHVSLALGEGMVVAGLRPALLRRWARMEAEKAESPPTHGARMATYGGERRLA